MISLLPSPPRVILSQPDVRHKVHQVLNFPMTFMQEISIDTCLAAALLRALVLGYITSTQPVSGGPNTVQCMSSSGEHLF